MIGSLRVADGTLLKWQTFGNGPPLLVVHGGLSDGSAWKRVIPTLAGRFTVCALDRRGYGVSGAADDLRLEREFEDVAAVAEALGGRVRVVGHSSGAVCALGAAQLTTAISELVLYEPPVPVSGPLAPPATHAILHHAIEHGALEEAWTIAMHDIVKYTRLEVLAARRALGWTRRLENVGRWVRELAELDTLGPEYSRFARTTARSLFLVGSTTAAHHLRATLALADVVPNARIRMIHEHGHFAIHTAPALFVQQLLRFFEVDDERDAALTGE